MIFRKVILGIFLALLLPLHAWGAVALVSGQLNSNSSSTATVTTATLTIALPAKATIGNAIAVAFAYGSSAGTPSLTTITDDQANTYTINQNNARAGFSDNAGAATILSLANTAQTISITVGNTVSGTIAIYAEVYEVSGATSVDVSTTGTTGSVTALNATFTTTSASEFAFSSLSSSGGPTWTQNNGWTQDFSDTGNGIYFFHNILTTSGANSLNATSSTANFYLWNVVTLKGTSGGCTNNFWASSSAWAVPNGTTGSYWSTTGASLTPNCSTGSYWLKSGAKGAN